MRTLITRKGKNMARALLYLEAECRDHCVLSSLFICSTNEYQPCAWPRECRYEQNREKKMLFCNYYCITVIYAVYIYIIWSIYSICYML